MWGATLNISQFICLQAIHAFKGERSIAGVFHLLQGKRSAQTIQDGHIYQSLYLFGTLSSWTKESFTEVVALLEMEDFIVKQREEHFILAAQVTNEWNFIYERYPSLHKLNGWKYKDVSLLFWKRMSLLVQCVSQLAVNEKQFIPVTKDKRTLQWMKMYLSQRHDMKQLSKQLHEELRGILLEVAPLEAENFVRRLSGHNCYGLTNEQIAEGLGITTDDCYLLFMATLHHMLDTIESQREQFRILSSFVPDITKGVLTSSSELTYKYLQQGFSIEEISIKRQLKRSTIEDHLIEIAIAKPTFSIGAFVAKEDEQLIAKVIDQSSAIRLRHIKDQLPNHINYFMIRLVLAKRGFQDDVRRRTI